MGLFHHNIHNDTILASEFVKVLYRANNGLETVVHRLSKERLGPVSAFFRKVIAEQDKIPIRENLKNHKKTNPHLRKLIVLILSRKDADLATNALADKEREVKVMSKRIDTITTWLVLLPLLPIVITLIDYLTLVFADIPKEAGFGDFSGLSSALRLGILGAGLVVTAILLILLKVKKE